MKSKVVFTCYLTVAQVMCFDACGNSIDSKINGAIQKCKELKLLPEDATFTVDPVLFPAGEGAHRLSLVIQSEDLEFDVPSNPVLLRVEEKEILKVKNPENIKVEGNLTEVEDADLKGWMHNPNIAVASNEVIASIILRDLALKFKQYFKIEEEKRADVSFKNIILNGIGIISILLGYTIFPPSLLLTIGLTILSFTTTAYTARQYLLRFLENLRHGNFLSMGTSISLGWILSLAHCIFHSIKMPVGHNFSMLLMNFIMPIGLISCINGIDEIKRYTFNKVKPPKLKDLKSLFPNVAKEYQAVYMEKDQRNYLGSKVKAYSKKPNLNVSPVEFLVNQEEEKEEKKRILEGAKRSLKQVKEFEIIKKQNISQGMLVRIEKGGFFPIDSILLEGNTAVDSSVITGEPWQKKEVGDFIPSGAVNLENAVTVIAGESAFNSTMNRLLFQGNAPRKVNAQTNRSFFLYFYSFLIATCFITAVVIPAFLGLGFPIITQNIVGILFSVCPCTIAIAHKLPSLINIYHRSQQGEYSKIDVLKNSMNQIKTVVFDKTGTLTTEKSEVVSMTPYPKEKPWDKGLWQRIYLAEKALGREHPIAKAIICHYEKQWNKPILFDQQIEGEVDPNCYGLKATVQGKELAIGNEKYIKEYLQSAGSQSSEIYSIDVPKWGTSIYIVEDGCFKGALFIRHQLRKGVYESLKELVSAGIKIFMLTGDKKESALELNRQINGIFENEKIIAEQTPHQKKKFLADLKDLERTGFVTDSLNDLPGAKNLSNLNGLSFSMNASDKSVFFTDICLNGSLKYLSFHNKVNRLLDTNILQNKWSLTYSALVSLSIILCCSLAKLPIPPFIPMSCMLSTTFFILFNAYRMELSIENTLAKKVSWPRKFLASNASLILLWLASGMLVTSFLMSTLAAGRISSIFMLNMGTFELISKASSMSAYALLGGFATMAVTFLLEQAFSQQNVPSLKKENNGDRIDKFDQLLDKSIPSQPTPSLNRALYDKKNSLSEDSNAIQKNDSKSVPTSSPRFLKKSLQEYSIKYFKGYNESEKCKDGQKENGGKEFLSRCNSA